MTRDAETLNSNSIRLPSLTISIGKDDKSDLPTNPKREVKTGSKRQMTFVILTVSSILMVWWYGLNCLGFTLTALIINKMVDRGCFHISTLLTTSFCPWSESLEWIFHCTLSVFCELTSIFHFDMQLWFTFEMFKQAQYFFHDNCSNNLQTMKVKSLSEMFGSVSTARP